MTLQDPSHSLRFTTVSQPSPADWLEVEYEKSDWVEERLVEVLRVGVEVIAQDVSIAFHAIDGRVANGYCSMSPRGWA